MNKIYQTIYKNGVASSNGYFYHSKHISNYRYSRNEGHVYTLYSTSKVLMIFNVNENNNSAYSQTYLFTDNLKNNKIFYL